MRLLGFLYLVMMFGLSSQLPAVAVEFNPVPLGDGSVVIVIKGDFKFGDKASDLEAVVHSSGAKTITFDSGGGNIDSALPIGWAIRTLGVSTVQARSMECSSACAIAFIGGLNRSAEPGSIGVHRTSFSDDAVLNGHEAAAAVQEITARIMTYMIDMGVDPRLLQLSLSTDSGDMRYLTGKEMQQYAIVTLAADNSPNTLRQSQSQPTSPRKTSSGISDVSDKPVSVAQTTEDRVRKFISDYHSAWSSSNNVALAFMDEAYGNSVKFYGKEISHAEVMNAKAAFVERWPKRAYSVVHGSERISCGDLRKASGTIEWFASSTARGKFSSGSAAFELEWDPSSSRIVSENGSVIQTDKADKIPRRIIKQWFNQNTACRGGSGDKDDNWKACDRREEISAKLDNIGWCYGRPGEAGYQMNWHACQ